MAEVRHGVRRVRRSKDEVLDQAIAKVKELAAEGGEMILSQRQYDAMRGEDAPSIAVLRGYGVSYRVLLKLAGLRVVTDAEQRRRREAHQVPVDLEEEIRAAFAAQAETRRFYLDHPMQAIPTGIDVRYVAVPGKPGLYFRVTSYRASLR